MKLKKEFVTHDTGDESLLVPVGGTAFSGLVKGNKTLGAILELLGKDTTEADIIAAMCARLMNSGVVTGAAPANGSETSHAGAVRGAAKTAKSGCTC